MILKIMRPGYKAVSEETGEYRVLAKVELYEADYISYKADYPKDMCDVVITFDVVDHSSAGDPNCVVTMDMKGERAFIMENGKTIDSVSV